MNQKTIIQLLQLFGVKRIKPRGHYISFSCLLSDRHENGEDKKPSMSVMVSDGGVSHCRCFTCGVRGSFVNVLREVNTLKSKNLEGVINQIQEGEHKALNLEVIKKTKSNDIDFDVFDDKELDNFSVLTNPALSFLDSKGVTERSVLQEFEIGVDVLKSNVVFPIRNFNNKLVGICGRPFKSGVFSDLPKYFFYWRFNKGKYLYGENHYCEKIKDVIIVEGFLDVLGLYAKGYKNVFAVMGNDMSKWQLAKLDFANHIYLFPDNDIGGASLINSCKKFKDSRIKVCGLGGLFPVNPRMLTSEAVDMCLENAEILI